MTAINEKKVKSTNGYFTVQLAGLFILQGLLSSLMREQANISHLGPKWIVLDGDIDPLWIESLNTVMDDNKVPPSCSLIRYCEIHSNQGDMYRKICFFFLPIPDILMRPF